MRLIPACLSIASLGCIFMTDGCRTAAPAPKAGVPQSVLLVCEHGNVKSLIAASLFNRMASSRGLPFRAEARGLNPDAGIPAPIAAALGAEGIDVSHFEPRALSHEDAVNASRVVAIGIDLSSFAADAQAPIQLWSDVPPASVDYASSRAALLRHLEALLQELQAQPHK